MRFIIRMGLVGLVCSISLAAYAGKTKKTKKSENLKISTGQEQGISKRASLPRKCKNKVTETIVIDEYLLNTEAGIKHFIPDAITDLDQVYAEMYFNKDYFLEDNVDPCLDAAMEPDGEGDKLFLLSLLAGEELRANGYFSDM